MELIVSDLVSAWGGISQTTAPADPREPGINDRINDRINGRKRTFPIRVIRGWGGIPVYEQTVKNGPGNSIRRDEGSVNKGVEEPIVSTR